MTNIQAERIMGEMRMPLAIMLIKVGAAPIEDVSAVFCMNKHRNFSTMNSGLCEARAIQEAITAGAESKQTVIKINHCVV
jgi:hypothetical protein